MKYRSEIDGLRALAVVPVILFHAGFKVFSGGFVGVDVFFVISGYLITTILLNDLEAGKFSIVNFYERRARRILPALCVVMLACLPFAWIWLSSQDMKSFSKSLVAVSIFSSNILFWRTSGYFDTATELKPLIHTWSLAVEEQYYVLFPLFLLFAWRLGKRWIVSLLAICAIISLAGAQYFSEKNPSFDFYLLPTRSWELLIGAFVAFYYTEHNIKKHKYWAAESGSLFGFALILYSTFAYDNQTPFPSIYALAPTLGAALIIVFATHQTMVGKLLGTKLFVAVGLISYSAYLWHQPLFAFARQFSLGQPGTVLMISLAAATVPLAYLTWRFVERPFRNRHRFTRNQVFCFAFVFSAIFIGIGLAGDFTDGFKKQRTTAEQLLVLKSAIPSPKRAECHTDGENYLKPNDACEYHTGRLRVAAFGDSHVIELAYALADTLKESNTKLKHFSFSGCSPMYGRSVQGGLEHCAKWTNDAVDYIVRNKEIDTVIVSYRINSGLYGGHEIEYPNLPDGVGRGERELVWKSYVNVLRHFVDNGKKVVLVLQAPELPVPVEDLLLKSQNPLGKVNGVSRDWWNQRSGFVRQHLFDIPKEVLVIDPAEIFCNEKNCQAANDGVAFYFDDDHLSVEGARLVVKEIIKRGGLE